MTILFAAIFILLAIVSAPAALVYAVALLLAALLLSRIDWLWSIYGEPDERHLRRPVESGPLTVNDAREIAGLPKPSARIITGRDHPLAAIGGVPRERR